MTEILQLIDSLHGIQIFFRDGTCVLVRNISISVDNASNMMDDVQKPMTRVAVLRTYVHPKYDFRDFTTPDIAVFEVGDGLGAEFL